MKKARDFFSVVEKVVVMAGNFAARKVVESGS